MRIEASADPGAASERDRGLELSLEQEVPRRHGERHFMTQ